MWKVADCALLWYSDIQEISNNIFHALLINYLWIAFLHLHTEKWWRRSGKFSLIILIITILPKLVIKNNDFPAVKNEKFYLNICLFVLNINKFLFEIFSISSQYMRRTAYRLFDWQKALKLKKRENDIEFQTSEYWLNHNLFCTA